MIRPHLVLSMYNTQHLPKPIVETKPPIITMEQVKYVYKILPSSPPEPLPALYPLSALDHADGFVHLSTNNQVEQPTTARRRSVLTLMRCLQRVISSLPLHLVCGC